ncbi:hypothetical protein OMW55_03975 [Sphingomonas sp. BN140010]|uniref:Uncharacterized protein n=1 Tax=Sphingomonas arvum TaxID=2992113 RepID=A0ABT3JD15_9SPHN|nr:hypothetical protein [Sphingomonas sp. BN140010]MCW3796963.1 hypothetical protein [Sphingomonas sp. BN140010]
MELAGEAKQGEAVDGYLPAMRQADGDWQFHGAARRSSLPTHPESLSYKATHEAPLKSAFHPLRTSGGAAKLPSMSVIDGNLLAQLPLSEIAKVTFYKRDELTTDLICVDVLVGEQVWTFHEELGGWDALIGHLERLPTFDDGWFAAVSQPAFVANVTVAFSRR